MTDSHKQRIVEAVTAVHRRGVYPSAEAVNKAMGRKGTDMAKPENDYRKEVMASLGIVVKIGRWK